MEIIRKKICIDNSITHTQGLMPYICFNDGDGEINYVTENNLDGNRYGFPLNPKEYLVSGKTYADIMDRYFTIQKQLRDGIQLKKVVRTAKCECGESGTYWTENFKDAKDVYDFTIKNKTDFKERNGVYYLVSGSCENEFVLLVENATEIDRCAGYLNMTWVDFCRKVEEYTGKFRIPQIYVEMGDKVPSIMYYADVKEYIKWMDDNSGTTDCCTEKLWQRKGGSAFTYYLKTEVKPICDAKLETAKTWVDINNYKSIPTIDIPILLTQNSTDNGVYSVYQGKRIQNGQTEHDESRMNNRERLILSTPYKLGSCRYSGGTYEVPSFLPKLRDTDYFYDDERKLVNGKMQEFTGSDGYFKCIFCEYESEKPSIVSQVSFKYSGTSIGGNVWVREVSTEICTSGETMPFPKPNGWNKGEIYQMIDLNFISGRTEISESAETTIDKYKVGESFDGGVIFESSTKLIKEYGSYNWWNAVKAGNRYTGLTIGDGLKSSLCCRQNIYRGITMLETLPSIIYDDTTTVGKDDFYYVLARYDNGITKPQSGITKSVCGVGLENITISGDTKSAVLPYFNYEKNIFNLTLIDEDTKLYKGDAILSAKTESGCVIFTYVIGGEFIYDAESTKYEYKNETGDIYEETHTYKQGKSFSYTLDGVSDVTIYVDYADFDADKKIGYSSRNGLSALTNTSILKEYTTGDLWKNSAYTEDIIYKEDYLLGTSIIPEEKIEVSYENGTTAVWEKHFKLGECNTFDDIKKYGNNYFNLQD